MAVIETKFSVGDIVYHAGINTVVRQHDCPDCNGSRKWKAISPAGKEYEFSCPRCCANYHGNDNLSLRYTQYEPYLTRLTIGSVRVDTHNDRGHQYMCVETGVGSGSIYYETDLFLTSEEATTAAQAKAAKANVDVDWVAKLYDKSVSLKDYELSSAERKANAALMTEWSEKNLDFWDGVSWADSIEQIQKLVEEYRSRS